MTINHWEAKRMTKYSCLKHGLEGHMDCEECMSNLKQMWNDNAKRIAGVKR